MISGEDQRLTAEARARVLTDQQLERAGWTVQCKKDLNLFAGLGVAIREVVMKARHGRADYLLYVDKAASTSSGATSPASTPRTPTSTAVVAG